MLLVRKFQMTGRSPLNGAQSGIWESFQPAEIAAAILAGTGAGMPDANGTPTAGTITPGTVLVLGSAGTVDLMTSGDLTAAHAQLPWITFAGDDDLSGRTVGEVLVFHGGARFDTERCNTGSSYTVGAPLIASAGILQPKAAVADHIQIVGFVGPRGYQNGVLDVIMPQGVCGY